MSRRRGLRSSIVLAVLTLAGSLALALFEAQPARADGLDVLCGAFDPVDVDENQITSVPGAQLTVDATDPDGTTIPQIQQAILPFGVPYLDTGGANIPFAGGAMRPVNIDGDPAADFSYGWGLRLSTAPGIGANLLGPNPIDTLFNNNFRLPDDYRNPFNLPRPYVSGVGADVHFIRASGTAVTRHKVELGGIVDFINRDGSRTHLKVRIGLDARSNPYFPKQLPDEANISLLARKANDPTTDLDDTSGGTLYLGLGLEFRYGGVAAADNPPLALTADVEIVDDAGNPVPDSDFLDLSLDFSHAPGDLAIGLRQRCTEDSSVSISHLSMNRVDANPSTNINVDLHSLAGSGLPTVPGGPAGDVMAVSGAINGLPQLVDVIMQPETIGVTRSAEVTPILKLDGLLFAPDDPETTTEQPLWFSGNAFGMPQHVAIDAVFDNPVENRRAVVSGATVECGPNPPAYPDPSLPIYPPNCSPAADASLDSIEFVAQNFTPQDTAAMAAVTEVAPGTQTCGGGQGAVFGYRQDVRPDEGGLWRVSGCALGVTGVSVVMPRAAFPSPTTRPRVTAGITRTAPSDIHAVVGAVFVDGSNLLRVEAQGTVTGAPADLSMIYQPTVANTFEIVGSRVETKSRNIFDLVIPPGLNVTLDRVYVAAGPVGQVPATLVYGHGAVSSLPPHLRFEAQTITSPSGKRILSATAETCPTMSTGDPFAPGGGNRCDAYGLTEAQKAVGDIQVDLQNFLPGDTTAADMPDPSPTAAEAAYAGNWATVAYRSPRDNRPVGHFTVDVKAAGVRSAAFDLSPSDLSDILSSEARVKAILNLAAPLPRALVTAQIDGRTSTTAASASGFLARASGVLSPVPQGMVVKFESRDYVLALFEDTPFSLTWSASSPIAVTWPYASLGRPGPENVFVQGPAPDLLTISGNVEIGNADGTGGLATGGTIAMTQNEDVVTHREITYAASAPTVISAGAVVSTATDRAPAGTANDLRTRLRAEVELPALPSEAPLRVRWLEAGAAVTEIGAYLCPSNEDCPDSKVAATIHRGKTLSNDNRTDLAPPVPNPQSMGGVVPIFSSFNTGPDGFAEGIRAVVRTDGTSAGQLAVRHLASVSAVLQPASTIRLRSDSPPILECTPNPEGWPPLICTPLPDPFTINVFVQPSASSIPVFVNGTLNDLPDDIVGRFTASGGEYSDDEPWIWLNTESVDIESPPDLTEVGGEAGGAQFDGTILVGNQSRIAPSAFERAFTATEAAGIKARASITTSSSGSTTLGFGATVRLRLPRHVEIWKPTLRSCGAGTATLSTCTQLEAYEAEASTRADIRVRTTADSLGFLKSRFEIDNGDQDYQGNVTLETVPGSLDAKVNLASNKRLPWTTLNLAYTTNVSPGDATLTVFDRCLPAYKGDVANSPQLAQRILPGQCITNQAATNKVANYDITLRDIPASVELTARIAASESPVLGTPREHIACPDSGYPGRGPTRLGYLHADLDFGSVMDDRDKDGRFDIWVDVRTGRTGQDPDPATELPDEENGQTQATVSSEGAVSGDLAAKILNVGKELVSVTGALGVYYTFQACIDFDLPIRLTFDDVRDLRMSLSGAKLGIFRNDSARVQGDIGESFVCTSWQAPLGCSIPQFRRTIARSGAPYARHDVSFTGPFVDIDGIIAESGRKWKGMGLIDVTDREPNDACTPAPGNCFVEAPANEFDTDDLDTDSDSIRRPDGTCCWEGLSSVMLLDPVWTTATRTSGALGLGEFYNTMNGLYALDLPADIPSLEAALDRDSLDGYFTRGDGFTTTDTDERAVASDGTRYMMYYRLVSPGGNQYQPELWALHPGVNRDEDLVRWIRPVGESVSGIIGQSRGSHDVTVSPNADGSVSVSLDFNGTAEDNAARFDASGNGRVLTGTTTVPTTAASGGVDRVIVLSLPAGSELDRSPSNGNTRRWYLGDGRTTGHVVNGGTMVRYSAPGTYYVLGIDYDSKGREMAQHAFVVTVS